MDPDPPQATIQRLHKERGTEAEAPVPGKIQNPQAFLELITQRELHYSSRLVFAERCLGSCKLAEISGRRGYRRQSELPLEERINCRYRESTRRCQPLGIGYIKNFPTEGNALSLPGKSERLVQAHIKTYVTGQPQGITITRLSGTRVTIAEQRGQRIAEDVRLSIHVV